MNEMERGDLMADSATDDRQAFREAMSMFATGITVVTAAAGEGRVLGVTVNSFTSISLDPPTVLVSLTRGHTYRAIEASGRYGVSVLRHDQADQCRYFSGHQRESHSPGHVFRGRAPTLADAIAWFECRVTQTIDVHDHSLLIGEVVCCGAEREQPLLYFAHRPQGGGSLSL